MVAQIPERIRPVHLARGNRVLAGERLIDEMPRLQSGLATQGLLGEGRRARVKLDFESGADGLACARGTLNAELPATCQRCLAPMELVLQLDVNLAFVASSEISVPAGFDSVELVDDELNFWELLEDELILALPITPLHEQDECQPDNRVFAGSTEQVTRKSPFSVLAALKDIKKED